MTANEYKIKHGSALKDFLTTEAGRQLIAVLHQLRPAFALKDHPHIHIEAAGAIRGYELCEKNFVFLSSLPIPNEEIEMTYGTETKQK